MANLTPFIGYWATKEYGKKGKSSAYSARHKADEKKSDAKRRERDEKREKIYRDKEIFSSFDDENIKVFEKAIKEFDKEKISGMIKDGFNINQCDAEGNTLIQIYRKWCEENFGRVQDEDIKRLGFLRAVGAKPETAESHEIKMKFRQGLEGEAKQTYTDSFPQNENIESVLKYEDKKALENLIAGGYNINGCNERGETLLSQYIARRDEIAFRTGFDSKDAEYKHLSRVADMLKEVGAVVETEESRRIKEEIRQQKAEEQALLQKERQERELNNSKLAKIRQKAAQKLGVKAKLPESIRKIEKAVSDKLFGKVRE